MSSLILITFSYLKTLLDLKKIYKEALIFFKFLIRNKILNTPIVVSFLMLSVCSWILISNITDDNVYKESTMSLSIIQKIDSTLKSCGDKTMIAVGAISVKEENEGNSWPSVFKYVRSCDESLNNEYCLVDLMDVTDMYNSKFKIDISSYKFLTDIGKLDHPKYFSLRGTDGKQNLDEIMSYPTLYRIMNTTSWYKKEQLNSLWVSSVINFNKKVIYFIVMISSKPVNENFCVNQGDSLNEIKSYLIKNE